MNQAEDKSNPLGGANVVLLFYPTGNDYIVVSVLKRCILIFQNVVIFYKNAACKTSYPDILFVCVHPGYFKRDMAL